MRPVNFTGRSVIVKRMHASFDIFWRNICELVVSVLFDTGGAWLAIALGFVVSQCSLPTIGLVGKLHRRVAAVFE